MVKQISGNEYRYHILSDAADGITKKFARPYDGPWKVTRAINPTTYEVADKQDKITKFFNQKAIKSYLPSMEKKFNM